RDWSVTGVQTCALPILVMALSCAVREQLLPHGVEQNGKESKYQGSDDIPNNKASNECRERHHVLPGTHIGMQGIQHKLRSDRRRSEERRVGKECRIRL